MAKAPRKKVALALQGGGAHGAFTWGVIDHILQDDRLKIEAISGTSAGAMNAVVLAEGLETGGVEAARQLLHDFWKAVSDMGSGSPIQRTFFDQWLGNWSLDHNPAYIGFDLMSRLISPYDLNPLDINPLRDLIDELIDFKMVRQCDAVKLFIAATNVHTGKVRIFNHRELTPDAVMASACLPTLYKAVEIDGIPYWDGGYSGNPPLFPLFNTTKSNDVIVVQINPVERNSTPHSAAEILNRINEISFNSSLLREMRAIEFVTRLLDNGQLDADKYKRVLLHRIEGDKALNELSASSKLNAEWEFFTYLRDAGRDSAKAWLDENYTAIGNNSSLDLKAQFN